MTQVLLLSSRWYSFLVSWFLAIQFFSRSSKLSQLYCREDPSKSLQGFTLCFQLLFPVVWSFFYYRGSSWRLHGGSSRSLFILQMFFKISLEAMIRQDILQVFFFLQSGVQFFLPYPLRWYYAILDNLSSCFMIHMLLRMRYFKSINRIIGVILGYISPKAFPKDCCYYGAYKWPEFFIYPPGEISFLSPCWYQSNLLFPLVAVSVSKPADLE